MIYIYKTGVGTEPHTDKEFAENTLKLGSPLATLTEQEWADCGGLARLIDGVLVLGKTPAEITKESLNQQATEAQKELDESDKYVVKCYDLNLVFADEYPELHTQREIWRQQVRTVVDGNA